MLVTDPYSPLDAGMLVGDYTFRFIARPPSYRERGRAHIDLQWDTGGNLADDAPRPIVLHRPKG